MVWQVASALFDHSPIKKFALAGSGPQLLTNVKNFKQNDQFQLYINRHECK